VSIEYVAADNVWAQEGGSDRRMEVKV